MALSGPIRIAAAGTRQLRHLVGGEIGDVTEARVGGDIEVQVAVDVIDGALRSESFDRPHHVRNGLHHAHPLRRRQVPQFSHVIGESRELSARQVLPMLPRGRSSLKQRIIYIGDVLHIFDTVPGVQPHALDQVEGGVRRCMTHVGGVVRRNPTYVHRGLFGWRGAADCLC